MVKTRIQTLLETKDGPGALALLQEMLTGYDLTTLAPLGMEDALSPDNFSGCYLASNQDGFCARCGCPCVEGETVWWNGPGLGIECEKCHRGHSRGRQRMFR
jgi:hypothetical protein